MPIDEEVIADYDSVGLSLKAHPIEMVRADLKRLQVVPTAALAHTKDKALIQVAGLVLVRQKPGTAKGVIFMTLEDEMGIANLVVWPAVWQRYRRIASGAVALIARGRVQRSGDVVHVVVNHMEDLSRTLDGLVSRSRDFH